MQYIVMDLEWNQPLSRRSAAYRRLGSQLMFEVIQIGAVKLDEGMRMIGSFNQFIAPANYRTLHPRISRITGIRQDDLADAPDFAEAFARFVAWCGDDFVLTTWGNDDISVLHQNIAFFVKGHPLPPVYDLQRLFGEITGETKNRAGLKNAMKKLGVQVSPEHPFHSAVDDAYYTALVFQRFPDPAAILNHPQSVRALNRVRNRTHEKNDTLRFSSLSQALLSRPARQPNCPVCGKRANIPEGYVKMGPDRFRALADCPDHGLVFVDLILEETQEGALRVCRRAQLSDEQSPAYIKTKHLQWARKVAAAKQKEVSA